jgi:hypothetical protein
MKYNNKGKLYKVVNAKINKKLIGDELDLKLITPKKPKPPVEPIGPDDGGHGDFDHREPPKPPRLPKAPAWFQSFEERNNSRFDRIENRLDNIESRLDKVETTLAEHGKAIATLGENDKKIFDVLERHDEIFKRNNLH